jgi:hypothetical protein
MSFESRSDTSVEIRNSFERRVPFVANDEDREIVFASTLDDSLMFFVTLPRKNLRATHARPAPTEPLDDE